MRSWLVDHAVSLADAGTAVLGITGAPGSGKSTLAQWLVARLRERLGNDAVAYAPMDGYHLADVDEVWFCTLDDDVRRRRLVTRHVQFGKTPEQATRWVNEVDEDNARLVERHANAADLMIPGGLPGPCGAVP